MRTRSQFRCLLGIAVAMLPGLTLAQSAAPQPPHAFLYGAWVGGMFPPPVTLSAQECLANPSVIFTRDTIMRSTVTDPAYTQYLVETVRALPRGVEFRVLPTAGQQSQAPSSFGLSQPAVGDSGFGCGAPGLLRVERHSDTEISFPRCSEYPYKLVRCPDR